VRQRFPDITLMLDANSAYTLQDAEHLRQLDAFDLLMLEQPLGYDDIYEHRLLQPQLQTPICLDESILSADDARMALELGACRIINLKPARVGGYSESLAIYRVCVEHQAPLWVGGMMETGVGRAANLAFASLPGVTLPCDISATDRYYNPDVTEPPFVIRADSTIPIAAGAGIGVQVVGERLADAGALWVDEYPY
jgi:O-succinylbenzoate synthase